jgi:RNA polymerase sigma factor (sigma-70 family)
MADHAIESRIDAALAERALKHDDRTAFSQLVLRHQGLVRAQLRRLTHGDHGWADDLAQEAFLQAWRKLALFRGEARFSTWLYRIAYMTFLQSRRTHRPQVQHLAGNDGTVEDDSNRLALRRDLGNAMQRLAEAERNALVLCYEFDLTHEEAAYVLNIPAGTVKTHVARGKAKLKQLLEPWRPESLS